MLRPCAIQASVVFLFLLPGLNARLRPTLTAQLRPGARVLSAEFQVLAIHLVGQCIHGCYAVRAASSYSLLTAYYSFMYSLLSHATYDVLGPRLAVRQEPAHRRRDLP